MSDISGNGIGDIQQTLKALNDKIASHGTPNVLAESGQGSNSATETSQFDPTGDVTAPTGAHGSETALRTADMSCQSTSKIGKVNKIAKKATSRPYFSSKRTSDYKSSSRVGGVAARSMGGVAARRSPLTTATSGLIPGLGVTYELSLLILSLASRVFLRFSSLRKNQHS
jgi:hypothetical protein